MPLTAIYQSGQKHDREWDENNLVTTMDGRGLECRADEYVTGKVRAWKEEGGDCKRKRDNATLTVDVGAFVARWYPHNVRGQMR